MAASNKQPLVVIPNWNGGAELLQAVDSLIMQTLKPYIVVVDNGSTDGSADKACAAYPEIELIRHAHNQGYAGGVNPGFQRAIDRGATYVAPFNDDAIADTHWLQKLVDALEAAPQAAAANPKVLMEGGKIIDSTGDYLTDWGLPYPRGRGEIDKGQYDNDLTIFAANGAASLYRVAALKQVGLLDEDFFAYYEDVDLGFRLQLAGWQAIYVPQSVVYHKIGMTSGRIKGFTTYQTMKNLPLLAMKNVPARYLWHVGWRLTLARTLFLGRAISRKQFWPALKGDAVATYYLFTKRGQRRQIQKSRTVSDAYIWGMLLHDLPPNAQALRKLRRIFKGGA